MTTHATRILSTTYSQENDSSYFGAQPTKEDFSEEDFSQSFDYIAEEDMSEEDAVSATDDIISDLRSQVAEYKTQVIVFFLLRLFLLDQIDRFYILF